MATKSSSTSKRVVSAAKTQGRRVFGPKAIGRLEKSLEAAGIALKDLRKELGRGSRTTLADFEKTFGDSRKNLKSLARALQRDAEKLQKAATQGTSPGGGSRRSTAKSSSGTRKRSTAKSSSGSRSRSTSSRSASASSRGRSSSGGAKRSTTRKSSGGRSTRSK